MPGRELNAKTLVELRDFGRADSGPAGEAPFSVSPDGGWAVMAMRRADTDRDRYCIGIMLVSLNGRATPRLLDVGGDFIAMTHDVRDAPDIVNGSPDPGTPSWSPDGSRIAFLRRETGSTQVWTVGLGGEAARQVTRFGTDVVGFRWSGDGRAILARTRPGLVAARVAIDAEGRTGFLFDKSFWTLTDDRPRPALPVPVATIAIDATSGHIVHDPLAENAEEALGSGGAQSHAGSENGATAWIGRDDPSLIFGPTPLHVDLGGHRLACPAAICADHVADMWWTGKSELLFMRGGSPDNGGKTVFYRWRVGHDATPVRLFETIDALFGCQAVSRRLVCAHESAVRPRTLVSLEPATGKIRTLFEPNPDFPVAALGLVQRLVWSRDGATTYGDLVLPPGQRVGERHPLVVVQYTSRGFLRGGTGDDVPIHLLAARGFAVLSFQRPPLLPATATARSLTEVQHVNIPGWAERRSIFQALDAGVDAAVATGAIDRDRIGITGLSDGASTLQYALLHSHRFKAAAMSSCCEDPGSTMVDAGLSYRDFLIASGYPKPGEPGDAFWRPYSLALNADRIRTPLLIQVPDGEYRLALESYSALQFHGAPVEMYVFPDEHHVKWHPAHRLAIYERDVAWFDFWLRDKVSGDPARLPEIRRWEALKAAPPPADRH
ncbi:MAG: Atxe2 family lasso peptide isopeptidase [Sphingomonas sp.]|uniref:Atxe2 family lasso peptide isopeptidase n=1 Tax=Sphingomonas sp. TaxID=28214 RepID=UPI003564A232